MGRCAMIWTTAGTNRVCSRCLALKDTIVGYTDELGVTLPPLHPRCRCAIMYDEVGTKLPNVGSTRRTRLLTEKEAEAARVDEEKAFNTPTGANFGFNKMKRTPDWRNEILTTNMTEIATPNCQRCVVAHEARMRGYDVVARPSWGEEDALCTSRKWAEAFKHSYADFIECKGKTGDEVIQSAKKIMRSFGEGARAIVIFKWDKNKTFANIEGHVIVAQCREKGNVIFGDPQTGKTVASYQLNSANIAEKILLLRVDNLPFTNIVKRCCKNRE